MKPIQALLVCVLLAGCGKSGLQSALDALDVACESRPALANIEACGADVGCKIDALRAYLAEHADDAEVIAIKTLLEEQIRKLQPQGT